LMRKSPHAVWTARRAIAAPFVLAILFTCSCTMVARKVVPVYSIVGLWKGEDRSGTKGLFRFHEDHTMQLVVGGKNLGSGDPDIPFFLVYAIDYDRDPCILTVVGTDRSGFEYGTMKMTVRFNGPDAMEVCTDFTETPPVNSPETCFLLERTSE